MADLITVAQYKDAEGLRGEKDDDRLAVIVPQVSDLVKKYCGISFIDFYSTDKVETFSIDDNYTTTIIMSESPLVTVDSVEERASYSGSYETLTTTDYEYYVDTESDAIIRTNKEGNPIPFKRGVGAVKVTYNAGYAATPEDLKLALSSMSSGMAVALYTTLTGLIVSTLLRIQFHFSATWIISLLNDLAFYTENNFE